MDFYFCCSCTVYIDLKQNESIRIEGCSRFKIDWNSQLIEEIQRHYTVYTNFIWRETNKKKLVMEIFRLILHCVALVRRRHASAFQSSTNQMDTETEKNEEKYEMIWWQSGDKMTESDNCAMNTNLNRFAISLTSKVSHLHEFQRHTCTHHLFASLIKFHLKNGDKKKMVKKNPIWNSVGKNVWQFFFRFSMKPAVNLHPPFTPTNIHLANYRPSLAYKLFNFRRP